MPADVSALVIPLGRYFLNRRLRHGIVNGIAMVRMFRRGYCRYEQRLMDEHLQILSGRSETLTHPFYDHSLLPLSAFIAKHNGYADREAALLLAEKYRPQSAEADKAGGLADAVAAKRRQKSLYGRMPLFWRSTAYFLYRYIVRLGFLDGKEGFLWDFLQGWWYRTLVDAKVMEVERACAADPGAHPRLPGGALRHPPIGGRAITAHMRRRRRDAGSVIDHGVDTHQGLAPLATAMPPLRGQA